MEAFKRIQLPQNIVEYTREALLSSHKEEKDFRDTKVKALTTRYKKLENYIDKLYEDEIESVIELHEWEKRTQTYKAEQDEIAIEIDALRRSNTAYMMEGIKLMEIANSASELFPLMDKAEKRELISLVLSNPVIEDATIRYDYKKPFDMFVDLEDIEKWRRVRDSNPGTSYPVASLARMCFRPLSQLSIFEHLRQRCGGETGIRTLGRSPYNGFQDRRLQPLGHLSSSAYDLQLSSDCCNIIRIREVSKGCANNKEKTEATRHRIDVLFI